MNRNSLFNELVRTAQSDRQYYIFGKPSQIGIIEDLLAYFGIDYKLDFHSQTMHQANLELLKNHIMNVATDEQLKLIYDKVSHNKSIPQLNLEIENTGKVFVSMPMNKEKCKDVNEIRKGISKAVSNSGNEVYFLDLHAHNDNIFNKVMTEIVGCKFLIADFTSQNTGVYYEAGYAKASGKTVIYTCKNSDFENVHFDIKQIQFVVWDDADDLAEKLLDQIKKSNLGGA